MFKQKFIARTSAITDEARKASMDRIENLGHVLYIRYLLTKRMSLPTVKKSLSKIGLSTPTETALLNYFEFAIWPNVEKFGLQKYYAKYYNSIKRQVRSRTNSLVYRLEFKNNPDELNFFRFIYYIDAHPMWLNELRQYYGSIKKFPEDEDGTPILGEENLYWKEPISIGVERMLQSPRRFEIDQMILEDVPEYHIEDYIRKDIGFIVTTQEVMMYKKIYFNIRAKSMEDKIDALVREKNSLEKTLDEILHSEKRPEDNVSNDRIAMINSLEQRIRNLDNNISLYNSKYNQTAANIRASRISDKEDVARDIFLRAYKRFCDLDESMDRAVTKPLQDMARIIGSFYDKIDPESAMSTSEETVLLELVKDNAEEIHDSAKEKVESIEMIDGVEELGINFIDEAEEEIVTE